MEGWAVAAVQARRVRGSWRSTCAQLGRPCWTCSSSGSSWHPTPPGENPQVGPISIASTGAITDGPV